MTCQPLPEPEALEEQAGQQNKHGNDNRASWGWFRGPVNAGHEAGKGEDQCAKERCRRKPALFGRLWKALTSQPNRRQQSPQQARHFVRGLKDFKNKIEIALKGYLE